MNERTIPPHDTNILIVDDTPDDVHVLEDILEAEGYEVRLLADAEHVLHAVQTHHPDLIFLDRHVRGIDGCTLCDQLKHDEQTCDIPIILISAHDTVEDKVQGFACGAVDVISKPYHEQEVLARASMHLTMRLMHRRLQEQNETLQQEIASRQRVEEALRHSEAALQQSNLELERRVEARTSELHMAHFALANSADGIFWLQLDGQFDYVNEAFCAMLGYTRDELLRMYLSDIDLVVAEHGWFHCRQLIRSTKSQNIEAHLQCKDGSILTVDMSVIYITFDDQERICAFVRDITERKRMQDAIEKERQRLFAVLDQLPVYVYLLDSTYTIRFANRYFREHIGLSDHHQCYQVFYQRETPCDSCYLSSVLNGFVPDVCEAQIFNGRTYQVYIYPFTDSSGETLVLELGIDITERKQAEAALRQSEAALQQANSELEQRVRERTSELRQSQALLQSIFSNAPSILAIHDTTDGHFMLVSHHIAAVTGLSSDQMVGKPLTKVFSTEHAHQWPLLVQNIIATGTAMQQEHQIQHYDGTDHTYLSISFPIRDSHGFIFAIGSIYTDITERKQMEENLRKFYRAVEQSPVVVVMTDKQGNIEYVNPKFTQVTGYTFQEAYGQNPRILKSETLPEQIYVDLWETILGGNEWVGEFHNQKKDKTLYWESASISPVTNNEGDITYFIAIKEDITERKQAEEELQQAKEAAEAANRAKSAFLANMSHELRTPLNAILGFAQLLASIPDIPAVQQSYLNIIERSGHHLLTLINDILEMSKIEAGRVSLVETECDLYSLCYDMIDMFHLRSHRKHVDLLLDFGQEVPHFVYVDSGKLRQVLINLLSNGIKFTEHGSVTLRVCRLDGRQRNLGRENGCPNIDTTTHSSSARTCWLSLSVEDTGIGIVIDELSTIFDAFVQTSRGRTAQEGTGLGLSISQSFVALMGGTIQVHSEPGRGSAFSFEIPVQMAPSDDIQEDSDHPRIVQGIAPDQPSYRILVVEDHEDNRKFLSILLAQAGFTVQTATNGQEAIDCSYSWQPHLIFMDICLPELDGLEATRSIKSMTRGQSPHIVALTAGAFDGNIQSILAAGCDDFIRKPFRQEEIFQSLVKHLGVSLVYEDHIDAPSHTMNTVHLDMLSAELTTLPDAWVKELHHAATLGSVDQLEHLLTQVREKNAPLAEQLAYLVHNFLFDRLITVTEKVIVS